MGRKRSVVTDTLALLLAVLLAALVTAASLQDSVAGMRTVDQVAAPTPTIRKVWADGGWPPAPRRTRTAWPGIHMECARHTSGTRGFGQRGPLPSRQGPTAWTAEERRGLPSTSSITAYRLLRAWRSGLTSGAG
ncbi:hypothetical protein GCM10014715_87080 [Streptomyces spiralis]|uniref:Secreted protein n=1 Tax=Streptomyces spiralis TaxID=66376 RepID=A0A919APH2_9ACTN|nr:hypothetical protein GCM10014715_87080 [Streptomyces spiralis]